VAEVAPISAKPESDAGKAPDATPPKPTIASKVKTTIKDANATAKATDAVIAEATTPPVKPDDAPAATDSAATTSVTSPVTAAMPSATAVPAAGETAEAAVVPAPPVAVAEQPPEPIVWPTLVITGVVGKERSGAAVINGKVIGVNETLDNVRVVAIQHQGALLEYKGETKVIKVGKPIKSGKK